MSEAQVEEIYHTFLASALATLRDILEEDGSYQHADEVSEVRRRLREICVDHPPPTVQTFHPCGGAICNKCRAPKGAHAIGEACNNNCGGFVTNTVLMPSRAAGGS